MTPSAAGLQGELLSPKETDTCVLALQEDARLRGAGPRGTHGHCPATLSNAYEQLRAGTGSAVCLPSAAKLSP